MEEAINKFVTEYNDFISLFFGIICVVGSIRNWDWLCNPIGKPHYLLLTRGLLRFIFFGLGVVIIICSLYFVYQRF